MTIQLHRQPLAGLITAGIVLALAIPAAALAHAGTTVGDYFVEAGWRNEPPVIGQANTVQITVTRSLGETPVVDLGAGDLTVVVSSAGSTSSLLALVPAFDATAGSGSPGTYEAELVPTAAGAATFHITGSIHGTPVDVTVEGGVVETSSGPVDAEPAPGLDPLLVAGIVALIVVVALMAFLFLRVRPAPMEPPGRARPGS